MHEKKQRLSSWKTCAWTLAVIDLGFEPQRSRMQYTPGAQHLPGCECWLCPHQSVNHLPVAARIMLDGEE